MVLNHVHRNRKLIRDEEKGGGGGMVMGEEPGVLYKAAILSPPEWLLH